MIAIRIAKRGTHAACWLRGDIVYVAWQDGLWLSAVEYVASTHEERFSRSYRLGQDAGAFPVFAEHEDRLILAYRLGEPTFAAVFVDAETGDELYRTPFRVDGNNPIAMGDGFAFVQHVDDDGYCIRWAPLERLATTFWLTSPVRGRGTGLSRVVNGVPILVDDDRASQPGMALVSYSPDGRLVAGERADVPGTPDGGVIVRRLS